MSQEIQIYQPLTPGEMANAYASQGTFEEYQKRIAQNTLRRQKDDLLLFAAYLAQAGMCSEEDIKAMGHDLVNGAGAWHGVTYGLVEGFVRWMVLAGYAIGSVNVRLSTIKRYCSLATKAGTLSADDMGLIRLVQGYKHKEGVHVDEGRVVTRVGHKKAQVVALSKEQCVLLKNQPDTNQGRRDTLLMCLLLDHGLRCGEIAGLVVANCDLTAGMLTFYREKVDKIQTHELTRDTLIAAIKYFEVCGKHHKPQDKLLMGSRKSRQGNKLEGNMSTRAITARVNVLGESVGVQGLSAHDGRHEWVDRAIRGGTDLKTIQDAGGWSSIAMPARYAASAKIANKGVKLA